MVYRSGSFLIELVDKTLYLTCISVVHCSGSDHHVYGSGSYLIECNKSFLTQTQSQTGT